MLPALELVLPSSKRNLSEAELEVVKEDRAYDMLLWSMVLIQYALLAWFLMDLGRRRQGDVVAGVVGLCAGHGVLVQHFGHQRGPRIGTPP